MPFNFNDSQQYKEAVNEEKKKGIPEKSSHYSNWLITVIALIIICGILGGAIFLQFK